MAGPKLRVQVNEVEVPRSESGRVPPRASRDWRSAAQRSISKYAVFLALLLFILFFSVLRPHTFFTVGNFQAIISTQAVLLLVALALTIPLRVGDFDLSIGFMLQFTMAVVTILTVSHHWAWPLAVIVCIAAGIAVGSINGFITVRLGINAFIVTLGTGTVLDGLTQAITGGATMSGVPQPIQAIAGTIVLGLPLVAYYAFGLAILLWYVYEHTPLGRYLLFVGGGRDAARLSGIPVVRLRTAAFIASATICAIAGVLAAGQLGAEDPSVGASYLLPAYAAAFLGATTITPGRFNALGTVVALYLVAVGVTGLQLLGAAFWVQPVFDGTALVVAVTFARLASREPAI